MDASLDKLIKIINRGDNRSVKAKKNIIGSFGIKGLAILLGFIKVPILLSYLDSEKYGVWLTIASIVDWVHYFDLGIGHGLRNKFAEALAKDNRDLAQRLVSTAYFYISIIFTCIFFILLPIILVLNWQEILNTTSTTKNELRFSVIFVLGMFVLRFIFYQISIILKGDQRPALSDLFLPVANIFTLITVLALGVFSHNSLFLACAAISAPPAIILIIGNIYFFNRDYKDFKPSFLKIDKALFKDTFELGLKFFVIQLSGLVLFASSNIILSQVVNPSEVTLYNISRQYFTIPFMVFGIILAPYWTAITDAYARNELNWIRSTMKRLIKIAIIFCFGEIILFVLSPMAYNIWIGDKVQIPLLLSFTSSLLFITYIIGAPFSHFLNGVGKLKVSIYIGLIQIVLYFPIAVYLSKLWGASGLVLSLIIVNTLQTLIVSPLQYHLIINNKAKGIWNA